MRKSIRTLGTIATIGIMLVGAYYLGTTQSRTVTQISEIENVVEVIPGGYINTASEDFDNQYVDIRTVVDYEVSDNGLLLHMDDGNGYYIEMSHE